MLIDNHWKPELKRLCREITFWKKRTAFYKYAEYRLSRALLYSAIILRKIVEDENEVKAILKKNNCLMPKLTVINSEIKSMRCPYTAEEGWTMRGKLCAQNYGKGTEISLQTKDVCNWLIHSYVWGIAHYMNEKKYAGFFVASDFDKEKFVHFISFDEWIKLIKFMVENAVF